MLYGKNIVPTEGQLYALQTATTILDPPSWVTPVGQAYRVLVSENTTKLPGATLSISYQEADVPVGEEEALAIYYYVGEGESCPNPEDSIWCRLTSRAEADINTVMASVEETGPGLYALMSSIRMPLAEGWNLVGYPLQQTKIISDALASIEDHYAVVYSYEPRATATPWRVYAPLPDTKVLSGTMLEELAFGRCYLIYATEPTTWTLSSGFDRGSLPAGIALPSTELLQTPPAIFYGQIESENPAAESKIVHAYVGLTDCAQGTLTPVEKNGSYSFVVQVPATSDVQSGCDAVDHSVTFKLWLNGRLWTNTAQWDNRTVQPVQLTPTVDCTRPPSVLQDYRQ